MASKDNFNLIIPILNTEYKVVVCWGDEKFVQRTANGLGYKEKISMGNNDGICYSHDNLYPLIILLNAPKAPYEIAVLAHEAVHAVRDIWDLVEEDLRMSDEIFAHSVGAIVRDTLEAINKRKKHGK